MKLRQNPLQGSVILCAMAAVLILSIIGGNILYNCTSRYNATYKQVKGWKDALDAAEAGGDIAFAEARKAGSSAGTEFTSTGWTTTNAGAGPWTYSMSGIGSSSSQTAQITVDAFTNVSGNRMFRIRSIGTARVFGLRRTAMDDGLTGLNQNFTASASARGNGDNLLRKFDFNVDHFIATYGDGDGNNKQTVPVPTDANGNPMTQVSRRIELIAVPLVSGSAAITTAGAFQGPGSAGVVDSYDSKTGVYSSSAAPNATAGTTAYTKSHQGNVADGGSTFTNQTGEIYGNVTTNGATLKKQAGNYITGTIDNNVAITVAPQPAVTPPAYRSYESTSPASITPPLANPKTSGLNPNSWENAPWYHYSSFTNVTVNPVTVSSTTRETFVNIVVDGDVSTNMTINRGANVRIYFSGNATIKVQNFSNNNIDGSPLPTIDGSANSTADYSAPGHVQFYGVSPTAPQTQTVNINPNGSGGLAAAWYVPGADVSINGNCDLYGVIVCKSFSENGNCKFHYDLELAGAVKPSDYRVASYVEDVR